MIDLREAKELEGLLNQSPIHLDIASSQICLQDLSPLVPALRNFTDTIELSASARGEINNINLEHLSLRFGDKAHMSGTTILKNIVHPEEAYIFGQVSKMYVTSEGILRLANNFSRFL